MRRLGILVGGGPAPGLNSVISAATIESVNSGVEVIGIRDGFKWLMRGDIERVQPLAIADVSRLHFMGGSQIGTSRDNPTTSPERLETTLAALWRLRLEGLITIGGDDTAYSATQIERAASGRLRVVHVPKTIDNDLDLPHGLSTFGFQTARHVGVQLVKNLMVDAQTTSRWYFVVTMGRRAGHLALGVGKAAGATLTVIPEEFRAMRIPLARLVDVLAGAVIKRLSYGRSDGVAILAEGLIELLDPDELRQIASVERDPHGHLRLGEISLGEVLKVRTRERLAQFDVRVPIVAKNIGYEMRCADPIPFDMEYTRDLGYCAARYILEGGSGAMISIQNMRFVPIPFGEMLDPATGRVRVRMVDVDSEAYEVALHYMIRLVPEDMADTEKLGRLAATAGVSGEEFRAAFAPAAGAARDGRSRARG